MELDDHDAVVVEPFGAGREQAPIRAEAVTGREDGRDRLACEIRIQARVGCGQVGQVGDDDVDLSGNGVEEIALVDSHAVAEAVAARIRTGELDGMRARVRRMHARVLRGFGESHGDRSGARAHVDDPGRPGADDVRGRGDELLGRRTRRHHPTGARGQGQAVEGDIVHPFLCVASDAGLTWT